MVETHEVNDVTPKINLNEAAPTDAVNECMDKDVGQHEGVMEDVGDEEDIVE